MQHQILEIAGKRLESEEAEVIGDVLAAGQVQAAGTTGGRLAGACRYAYELAHHLLYQTTVL